MVGESNQSDRRFEFRRMRNIRVRDIECRLNLHPPTVSLQKRRNVCFLVQLCRPDLKRHTFFHKISAYIMLRLLIIYSNVSVRPGDHRLYFVEIYAMLTIISSVFYSTAHNYIEFFPVPVPVRLHSGSGKLIFRHYFTTFFDI